MSNERKPHKHAEVIKAWADGKVIQFFDNEHGWTDVPNNRPLWIELVTYRVKPEPVKVRYRVAVCKRGDKCYPVIASDESGVKFNENFYSDFVKWIHTEWQEVEVPQ